MLQSIAVTGGTGFLGTWLAEMVVALNDVYGLSIALDLLARDVNEWAAKNPHLASRSDITLRRQDVRTSFEFPKRTTLVIHAAGIPNNRVHSSDPLRVYQTTVDGINNTLDAAAKLDGLRRFVNVSSCLVAGTPTRPGPLSETDYFPIPAGALHSVYTDAKRSAESLAAIYRSQFRLPISTVRLFTLSGAYQELDRPWAMNSFFHDILTGREMRIHGDGSARRSYLYGSDAAWGILAALVRGVDGEVYNLGSGHVVSHLELATLIAQRVGTQARFALNTSPGRTPALDDLFPDVTATESRLGFHETVALEDTVDKTYRWFSSQWRGRPLSG
jgi:dTDP-glucose 4,6-dehydratase